MPKHDGDAVRVRFDRKLAAPAEGPPTVGGGILEIESIQWHVVTCVVAALMAGFCVGWAGSGNDSSKGSRYCYAQASATQPQGKEASVSGVFSVPTNLSANCEWF